MNIKQKIYQYQNRMDGDLSAYYDLLDYFKSLEEEMLEDLTNELDITAKLKVRDTLNEFLSEAEPFELQITNFFESNNILEDDQSIFN